MEGNTMNKYGILLLFFALCQIGSTQIFQWGGPQRTGVYPDKNLADTWPESGPEMLVSFSDAGMGYGSPTITGDALYVAGMHDTTGFIQKYALDGKKLWQTAYGYEFTYKYLGSRGTPTVEDKRLYYSGTYGDVVCVDTDDGSLIWKKNIFDLYGGSPVKWGYTESPLLYDDLIILTPGGEGHNLVALSKHTGELKWSLELENAFNAYCSPVLIEHNNKTLAMVNTNNALLLFNPANGEIYLKHAVDDKRGTHSMPPLYLDDKVFYTSGYGEGSAMFTINDVSRTLDTLWHNKDFDCKMSGLFVKNGIIFGTSDRKKQWMGISEETGETLFESREIKPGSFVMADNKFYIFSETGEVALAHPKQDGFEIVSRFLIPETNVSLAFAHPVIFKGILYIRFNNTIFSYKISN